MDFQPIIDFDKQLLLMLNGSESLFLDSMVMTLTTAWTWVPLYISLLIIVIKNSDTSVRILLTIASAGLCVLLAGTIDDTIVKPLVGRWRPTRDPEIGLLVDIVDGYRGGDYGFFSAHAANTFSIAIFFSWLVRSRLLTVALVLWSLTNCWTRLYLGVHFPGDILVGLCWGGLVGTGVYFLFYRYLIAKLTWTPTYTSLAYTKTGYNRNDADVPVCVLTFTLIYVALRACLA
jgi:undecaprenyl-diphosphatase